MKLKSTKIIFFPVKRHSKRRRLAKIRYFTLKIDVIQIHTKIPSLKYEKFRDILLSFVTEHQNQHQYSLLSTYVFLKMPFFFGALPSLQRSQPKDTHCHTVKDHLLNLALLRSLWSQNNKGHRIEGYKKVCHLWREKSYTCQSHILPIKTNKTFRISRTHVYILCHKSVGTFGLIL